MIVSPFINMVLCISQTIFSLRSSCLNIFLTSRIASWILPPRIFIATGLTYALYSALRFLNSNASCLPVFWSRVTRLFSCGYTISQIHKIFFSLSSNVKSGLLDVVVILRLNSKSYTSFAWLFSRTYPLHHFSLYHFKSFSTKLNPFAH